METVPIFRSPPGGPALFAQNATREYVLVWTFDLAMGQPDLKPELSLLASARGYRRAFTHVDPSMALQDGNGAHPFRDRLNPALELGGAVVQHDQHFYGLAMGLVEAPGETVSGVLHMYPKRRERRVRRVFTLQDAPKPVERRIRIKLGPYPIDALVFVPDPDSPCALPEPPTPDVAARVLLNATPSHPEPRFPRGRHCVTAMRRVLEKLYSKDSYLDDVEQALRAFEAL